MIAVPILLMLGLLLPVSSSRAQVVAVDTSEQGKHALIRVFFSGPVEFTPELKGRELLLQFNRELRSSELDALPQRLPAWIEAATTGFDTLLFRTTQEVQITVTTANDKSTLEIALQPTESGGDSADDSMGQLRLDILQTQLYLAEGKGTEALKLSKELVEKYPGNAQVLANLATVGARNRGWRWADTLYRSALQLEPHNEDIVQSQKLLFKEVAPCFVVDVDQKKVQGAQGESFFRLHGHQLVRRYLRLGYSYDLDNVSIDHVRYSEGQSGPIRGIRQRGEIYIQQEFEGGLQLRGSFFAADSRPGLGSRLSVPGFQGETFLEADYHRPYWEYIESLANGGTRNRLAVGRQQRLGPKLNGSLSGGIFQYRVRPSGNVASSFGVLGNLTYLVVRSRPLLSLEYDLDGEYRHAISTWTASDGLYYNPIPLRSREVHAASALIGQDIRSHLRAEAYGGFAWDRLGGHGPFGGLRLNLELARRLEVQVWFDRRLNSINTGERVTRWGATLQWRFW